jgi:hypothetical protein
VPPRVDAAVRKAMAKRPEDRFPTMADFCRELEACLAELGEAGTQVAPALAAPKRARRRHASPWPIVLALAVLAAAGAIAAYLVLHDSGSGSTSTAGGGGGGAPVRLTAIGAYDPYGDRHEHDDKASLATDASPDTYWETEHYRSTPSLGKAGVGLVLDAGSVRQLHQLGFSTSTPGLTAEIRAGDASTGPFDTVVAGSQTVGSDGQVQYRIHGGEHRYYVIWITRLGDGYQTARINDVRAN